MPGNPGVADIRDSGEGNPPYKDTIGGVMGDDAAAAAAAAAAATADGVVVGRSVGAFVLGIGDSEGRRLLNGLPLLLLLPLFPDIELFVAATEGLGTMVGGSGLCEGVESFTECCSSTFGGEGQMLRGMVGLRDGAEEEDVELGGDDFLLPAVIFCCMRQWILNQLDRRPYRDPDLDIPTMRHLRKRHALHAVRFFLSTTQR